MLQIRVQELQLQERKWKARGADSNSRYTQAQFKHDKNIKDLELAQSAKVKLTTASPVKSGIKRLDISQIIGFKNMNNISRMCLA